MRGILLALALAAAAFAASSAQAAPPLLLSRSSLIAAGGAAGAAGVVSSNWAGYAVTATTTVPDPNVPPPTDGSPPATITQAADFTSVTGTWIEPKATCTRDSGSGAFSAVWVGLGGYVDGSRALEQIGTDADCGRDGTPRYYAWYELVPSPSVPIDLKIRPDDTITTSVNVSATNVLLQIKDRTRRTSFTKSFTVAEPDLGSAEWIVEAPSACNEAGNCRTLPLANFGSVVFTRIATTASGHAGTLTDPTFTATSVQLVPDETTTIFRTDLSSAGATPGEASADGRSFRVDFDPNPSPAP